MWVPLSGAATPNDIPGGETCGAPHAVKPKGAERAPITRDRLKQVVPLETKPARDSTGAAAMRAPWAPSPTLDQRGGARCWEPQRVRVNPAKGHHSHNPSKGSQQSLGVKRGTPRRQLGKMSHALSLKRLRSSLARLQHGMREREEEEKGRESGGRLSGKDRCQAFLRTSRS